MASADAVAMANITSDSYNGCHEFCSSTTVAESCRAWPVPSVSNDRPVAAMPEPSADKSVLICNVLPLRSGRDEPGILDLGLPTLSG